jgi:predicted  nucleic acid-binding Zn-ribbon protein
MALKTRVLVLETLKETEETTNAQDHRSLIRDRMKSLEQKETQLDQRTKVLREVLEEYEAEGSGLLEKLGARYEEIEKEMQTASKDIERLGRQSARIA